MKIGFIGFGNMGKAIAEGLLRSGRFTKGDFFVSVAREESKKRLTAEGWKVLPSEEIARKSDLLFLAVKPKDGERVLKKLREHLGGKVLVSVLAGVSLEKLNLWSPNSLNVRTMPNVNVSVSKGVWGVSFPEGFPEDKKRMVLGILELTGLVLEIDESLMNALTALAGSGPAFVAELLDTFAQAGVKLGFKYPDALKIALYTFGGTVEKLLNEGKHPAILRDSVTSPGGTTAYGLSVLNEEAIKGKLIKVFEAAKRRADELV